MHQLQRGHGPRAIYFAFCHVVGAAGAIRELPLPDSATAAWKMGWCSVLESNQAGPLDARVTVSPGSVPV